MGKITQHDVWQNSGDKRKGFDVADKHDPNGAGARTPEWLAERMRAQSDRAKREADRQLAAFLHRHRHWRDTSTQC